MAEPIDIGPKDGMAEAIEMIDDLILKRIAETITPLRTRIDELEARLAALEKTSFRPNK